MLLESLMRTCWLGCCDRGVRTYLCQLCGDSRICSPTIGILTVLEQQQQQQEQQQQQQLRLKVYFQDNEYMDNYVGVHSPPACATYH
ncbi:hypothetical protein V1477_011120 [Vespula maculifrons]|uniref:Uncharacterized protein n=1 Tax=Vespula maculifrons TaxID=7453 RepID=A0ABD2C3W1_VESMC